VSPDFNERRAEKGPGGWTGRGRRAGDGLSPPGSREHLRQTLARAREVIARSRAPDALLLALVMPESGFDPAGRALRESHGLRAELRAAVTAYVRHLRREGEPPQRMLVLVKDAVGDSLPTQLDQTDRRALLADVVRWSIAAYYRSA
jgi:hypothetical protein